MSKWHDGFMSGVADIDLSTKVVGGVNGDGFEAVFSTTEV